MKRFVYPLLIVVCAGLAACGTSETQAPIEDRSVSPVAARAPAGPGYYTVTKGDTLYRISRAHNQSVANLVAWNNLNNANEINEGQVLRVAPPGAVGTSTAAVQTASVSSPERDVQPIVETKTQPTAEKQVYSESAVAGGSAAAATATIAATGATREASGIVWGWPASGKVLRGFSEGQSKGVDIDGSKGQKVFAAADGRVIYSGAMNGYGNLVIIKHNEDLLTAYAHNSSNLVAQGSTVSRGQPVAEMGNSGTDSVKLHFEVRKQGKPVDPLGYLPKR